MNFIKNVNLPDTKALLFIADCDIPGAAVIKPPEIKVLSAGMRRHADIGICVISEKTAVCPPDTCTYYKNKLTPYGFNVIEGKTKIGCNYPADSAYNVCIAAGKCFMNTKICDSTLLECIKKEKIEIIHVNQGYAKCSVCPVGKDVILTCDSGIYKAAVKNGMRAFLVNPDRIKLDGFSNGFIGGCCGMMSENTLLVNGEIKKLTNGKELSEFLKALHIEVISLKKGELADIGSVIPLMTT